MKRGEARLGLKSLDFGTAVGCCGEVGHMLRLSCWCWFIDTLFASIVIVIRRKHVQRLGAIVQCNVEFYFAISIDRPLFAP